LSDREIAPAKKLQELGTDGTGSADDCQVEIFTHESLLV
jgi:hypothetical protein